MSFFDYIEKIRSKPEKDRRAISMAGASLVFSLVFFVWLTTFQIGLNQTENDKANNEVSPISSLKEMSSRFFTNAKGLNSKEINSKNSLLSSQEEMATVHTAVTNFSDENVLGTTTENVFEENSGGSEDLLGTLGDNIQVGMSSAYVPSSDFEEVESEGEKANKNVPDFGWYK